MVEERESPIEKGPTSEFVDDLELIFGRGRSGYKVFVDILDVYPHRDG